MDCKQSLFLISCGIVHLLLSKPAQQASYSVWLLQVVCLHIIYILWYTVTLVIDSLISY